MVRPLKGILTKSEIAKRIKKSKSELESLQRISKLQKKFQLAKPRGRTTRTRLRKRIELSKAILPKDKKKVKIFEFKGPMGRKIFVAGIPKGVKIKKIFPKKIRRRR